MSSWRNAAHTARPCVHESDAAALCDGPLLPVRGNGADGAGDDPVREVRPIDRVAQGYAELLGRIPWQQFWTLTFRADRGGRTGGMHAEAADKAFRYFVSCINRAIYSARWAQRWHGGIQWARGQEFHKDGRLHFHAVASAPTGDLNRLVSRYAWHEFWFREFGRNRIEAPRSQADIAGYVSKYVTKGGEVDFSRNFGAWQPPPMDFTAAPQQTHLTGCGSTNGHPRTGASAAQGRAPGRSQRHGALA